MNSNRPKHFFHLWTFGAYLIACIFLPFYLTKDSGAGLSAFSIWAGVGAFVFLCVPTIVIYPVYLSALKAAVVRFTNDGIKVRCGGKSLDFRFSDIDRVRFHLSIPEYFSGLMLQVTDSLYYAEIFTRSGDRFTITSISDIGLIDTSTHFFGRVRIERCWSLYCIP